MSKIPLMEFIAEIHTKRKLPKEVVVGAFKEAVAKALQKQFEGCPVKVNVDLKRGTIEVFVEKQVVEDVAKAVVEQGLSSECLISLEEARKISPSAIPGATVLVPVPLEEFDRATVYRIKNIFTQKIREAIQQNIYKEFASRVGEIETVEVKRVDHKKGVLVSIRARMGAAYPAEGLIPPQHQIPGERYRQGMVMKALIVSVGERGGRGIILSRAHNDFLRRLMEQEITEIMEGLVEIKGVARIPGRRAKVAVASRDPLVDPVGACVGHKGTRTQAISKALAGEKIDVVRWDPNPVRYAFFALAPVKPLTVYEDSEADRIVAVVSDDEVDTAKGEEGMNVKLASALLDKRVDVIPESEYQPVKGVVTLLDLKKVLPEAVIKRLRDKGYTSFTQVPTLAAMHAAGLDERTALAVLEKIEELLNEQG